ncbi:MAG: glycosyltransferase [Candidatus Moraniibacteriota bacterium]
MFEISDKNNDPLVSVIIPSYNQAIFLSETLDSVLEQDYKNWECIIIDDGSTDNTKDIAQKYCNQDKRFEYIKQENQGPSVARNNGILNSSGKYILPLDSDDLISKDYLQEAVGILENKPKIKLVYCKVELFGDALGIWNLPEYSYEKILFGNMIFCTAMFRRLDYDSTSGYDEKMKDGLEDWDFWLSFLKENDIVYQIPKVHFFYRIRKKSRNKKLYADDKGVEGVYEYIFLKHKILYDGRINPLYEKYKEYLKNQEIQQKDQIIQEKNQEIQRKDQSIQQKDQEIQQKDQEIGIKNQELENKENILQQQHFELNAIKKSLQWRIPNFFYCFYINNIQKQIPQPIFRMIDRVLGFLRKIRVLYQQAVISFRTEGFRNVTLRIWNYIFYGEGFLEKKKDFENNDIPYKKWISNIEREKKIIDYRNIEKEIKYLSYKPKVSIILPVYNTDEIFLRKAIFSVLYQYYENWELCIIDDKSDKIIIKKILNEFKNRDHRVKVLYLDDNLGISGATNKGVEMATGEFIAFLDHDDELEPEALYENIKLLNKNKELDLIYSDDDKIDENGFRYDPQFKPDWSPELLLSYCYISHFKFLRKSIFIDLKGFRSEFDGSQDFDFLLRLAEVTEKIGHIPKILYHWRSIPGSVAYSTIEKPASIRLGQVAVQEALDRRGIKATAVIPDFAEKSRIGVYKLKFNPKDYQEKVTIIIPTKDNIPLLKRCIDSIKEKTNYSNYEILVINNNSIEKETFQYFKNEKISVIDIKTYKFNFSKINNLAVDKINSELILFLNNDTEIISSNWLLEMVGSISVDKKIGAIGAKLIYADNRIQHAGVVLGLNDNSAGHAHKLMNRNDSGYLSYALVLKNYSAVTAACLLTKKSLFKTVDGFNEKDLAVSYGDVDYCLKILEIGSRIVYNPSAILYHHEGKTRGFGDNLNELNYFKNTWKKYIKSDPYYNINLSLSNEQFRIKEEN